MTSPRRRRLIDQAMCNRAELLARSHPLGTVATILGLLPSQITRMRQRGWKAADYSVRVRARPTDFAIQSAAMTFAELARHYGCGNRTLKRWFTETPDRRASWKGCALTQAGRQAWEPTR